MAFIIPLSHLQQVWSMMSHSHTYMYHNEARTNMHHTIIELQPSPTSIKVWNPKKLYPSLSRLVSTCSWLQINIITRDSVSNQKIPTPLTIRWTLDHNHDQEPKIWLFPPYNQCSISDCSKSLQLVVKTPIIKPTERNLRYLSN